MLDVEADKMLCILHIYNYLDTHQSSNVPVYSVESGMVEKVYGVARHILPLPLLFVLYVNEHLFPTNNKAEFN